MPFHFESNVGPNHKEYTEGGSAYINGKPRKAPFKDQKSPEAIAWYKGYDEAKIGGDKDRLKEIAILEKMYKK